MLDEQLVSLPRHLRTFVTNGVAGTFLLRRIQHRAGLLVAVVGKRRQRLDSSFPGWSVAGNHPFVRQRSYPGERLAERLRASGHSGIVDGADGDSAISIRLLFRLFHLTIPDGKRKFAHHRIRHLDDTAPLAMRPRRHRQWCTLSAWIDYLVPTSASQPGGERVRVTECD